MQSLVLADIRDQANFVLENEEEARAEFIKRKERQADLQTTGDEKKLREGAERLSQLDILICSIYEDKVLKKVPEEICIGLLEKYQTEKEKLEAELSVINERLGKLRQDKSDVDEFIRRIKRYAEVTELTRELCLDIIEYITIDRYSGDKDAPRSIHIYYKFIDKKPIKGE